MYKHLFIITGILLFVFSLGSCKKENVETYNTTNSIYFENINDFDYYVDSSYINYAYSDNAQIDSVIRVALKVTGPPSDKERKFKIVIDDSSTAKAGVHFQALPEEFLFTANKVTDTIDIRLLRAIDLKQAPVTLFLILQPNESFTTNLSEIGTTEYGTNMTYVKYKIEMSDILVQPRGWSSDYGKFTKKKLDIVCELGKISPLWFVYGDAQTPYGVALFWIRQAYFSGLLKNYLLINKENGTPVYYEDGVTLMRTDDY